jgi:hypothetical protein
MFQVKYSFRYKFLYGVLGSLGPLFGAIIFIWEGFIRNNRDYDIWIQGVLFFFTLFFMAVGVYNLIRAFKEFDNKLEVYHNGKMVASLYKRQIEFDLADVKSYAHQNNGSVLIHVSELEATVVKLDLEMENIYLLLNILSEHLSANDI